MSEMQMDKDMVVMLPKILILLACQWSETTYTERDQNEDEPVRVWPWDRSVTCLGCTHFRPTVIRWGSDSIVPPKGIQRVKNMDGWVTFGWGIHNWIIRMSLVYRKSLLKSFVKLEQKCSLFGLARVSVRFPLISIYLCEEQSSVPHAVPHLFHCLLLFSSSKALVHRDMRYDPTPGILKFSP